MFEKFKPKLNKLKKTGFFSIFLSSVFSKVLVFIGSTIIVRILSKTDYGIYAYILNCVSMLCLLNDFGASTGALQFLTEVGKDDNKKGAIINYSLKMACFSAVLSSILILLSPLYYPFTLKMGKELTPYMFFVPFLTTLTTIFPVVLRANLDNKKYAKLQLFSTFSNYVLLIILSLLWGLVGAIVSHYIYYIVVLIYAIYLCKNYLKNYNLKNKLLKEEKKEFLKFSLASQINNSISGFLIIVDTFLIGLMVAKEEVVAIYKVASAIPHALTFISSCVAIYILPYFIKNNNNFSWIRVNLKKLITYGFFGYGIICLFIIIFSKFIINLVYGSAYLDAVPTFIVLMVGLFFSSTFKVPCANIIHSMKKVRINIIVNVISIVINVISNIIFIRMWGFIGAAVSTTLINILSSIFYVCYLYRILNIREREYDKK